MKPFAFAVCLLFLSVVMASSTSSSTTPTAVSVSINWSNITRAKSPTVPSLQVVAHTSLYRKSPIHNAVFASLKALKAQHVRYAPWLPYPRMGVAELDPPTKGYTCTPMSWVFGQFEPVLLHCGDNSTKAGGSVIQNIQFASYGRPQGHCGAFVMNASCHANTSLQVVQQKCLGKNQCWLSPEDFGSDPCPTQAYKYVAVQAQCSDPNAVVTHWNFTVVDEVFSDFYNSVNGDNSAPIINFCTEPAWIYADNQNDWSYQQQPDAPWYGYTRGASQSADLDLLGDYYGRLASWYTKGEFTSESGAIHKAKHTYKFQIYEIFNEVDYEHGYTPETYTKAFDAVVRGIRKWADPSHAIKFVGMSLPNIDDTATVTTWAKYFLNASNHDADVRASNALNYIGYHAYPTNGPYSSDPTTFSLMFNYVDDYLQKVTAVDAVIRQMSPTTKTMLDECGTDMDQVLNSSLPIPKDSPYYWVASGGYFAYLYTQIAAMPNTTVEVVGESQLMDGYPQEPSVTILDWATGRGTARYWVLKMLIDAFPKNTVDFVGTSSSSSSTLYAQGFVQRSPTPKKGIVLVNKVYSSVDVTVGSSSKGCSGSVVDVTTGLNEPNPIQCGPGGVLTLNPYATAIVYLS